MDSDVKQPKVCTCHIGLRLKQALTGLILKCQSASANIVSILNAASESTAVDNTARVAAEPETPCHQRRDQTPELSNSPDSAASQSEPSEVNVSPTRTFESPSKLTLLDLTVISLFIFWAPVNFLVIRREVMW
jgi:hypothetical protein